MAISGDTLNTRFNNALNLPLSYRCDELVRIFEEYGSKELQLLFPHLLENIFGLANQTGWGLRTVYRNCQLREFEILFGFLQPGGPLFRLCYKLLTECYVKYEFPLTFLPQKVRKLIEDGMVPPFYADKLQIDPQTRVPTSLILNSFEFYIFHFAYHLVNPWFHRSMDHGTWSMWETPYIHLSEEYLIHFLPCDGSAVPPYAGSYVHPKSSLPLQTATRPVRSPTLFRQSVILKQNTTSSTLHTSPTLPQQNSMVEIWRSESVIQVFIDFWLSYGEREMPLFGVSPRPYSPSVSMENSYPYFHNQMNEHSNMSVRHYPDLLPSIEHIRVVRNLIKHLHYFANSIVGDMSAMDELKRIILPSSQAKIYGFLRHTIHHWPLDTSFRIILETWLSYIQPWRYTDWRLRNLRGFSGRENEDRIRSVDPQWINFIAENLLSYTVIFRQLLPRFQRLELPTPKNSHMLFRVTKVFSQPNLNRMLMEVERCLEDVSGHGLPSTSKTNPEASHQGHKWSALVRQQVLELEGPGFQYKAMFGSDTMSEVFQFMMVIQRAYEMSRSLLTRLEIETTNQTSGFFSSVVSFLSSSPSDNDEYSLEDRRRVSAYLETCLAQLSAIFEIDLSRLPCMSYTGSYELPQSSTPAASSVQQREVTTPKSTVLPHNWKERRRHIKYEGDPDLQPIRTTEIAFLVRLLYQISSKLNEIYTLEMCHLYEHTGVLGYVARQVLLPPMVARTYDKSKPGFSPQVEVVLPPRLSLRSLASHRTVMYTALGMFCSWIFGYGASTFLFLVSFLWFILVLIKAIFEPLFGDSFRQSNQIGTSNQHNSLSDNSF